MTENNDGLAGATSEPTPEERDEAVEVYPISFEKDFMDFRPIADEGSEVAPKASSAPVSVTLPTSVTGLEDVSEEELESPATPTVTKETPKENSQSENGSLTSSKETSTGKKEQPAEK